jgi:heme/copper-type cytochrome/quinol oxidase subunit 2
MNLIILLCIPLVPAIIVTIYAVVDYRKRTKNTEPETA